QSQHLKDRTGLHRQKAPEFSGLHHNPPLRPDTWMGAETCCRGRGPVIAGPRSRQPVPTHQSYEPITGRFGVHAAQAAPRSGGAVVMASVVVLSAESHDAPTVGPSGQEVSGPG